jgi:acetyl-CoA carboxylase carboxyl transferase subunit alpha
MDELKAEIKELENINTDKMINVSDEILEAKKRLKNLERINDGNLTAWEKVEIARNPKRPTALDYVDFIFDEFMELHGDRTFSDDKSIVCGLARIGEQNYTIIAEQKGRTTKENIERNFGMPNPESYKKGIRFMKQAEKFGRPIVTFIDTKGAYPGIGAEERGQGEAIARSMFEMANLKTPIIVVVIGEGSSGGALAIGVGDRILMLENAIYSILSPEGYASILWKDGSRKEEAAEKMKLTSEDLLSLKVIDEIIKEPAGGVERTSIDVVASNLKTRIVEITKELKSKKIDNLVEERYQKFRNMGEYIKEEN